MTSLTFALLYRDAIHRELNSAQPWAPVVPQTAPHSLRSSHGRAAIAVALRAAAEALAPVPARDLSSPAHGRLTLR